MYNKIYYYLKKNIKINNNLLINNPLLIIYIKNIINNINILKYIKNKNKNKNKINFDYSIPNNIKINLLHIISYSIEYIQQYFIKKKFIIINSQEIDSIKYNFNLLNIKKNNPVRSIKDTFYINNIFLLRTHTSNIQSHIIKNNIPPFKIISLGKVYRKDFDATHTPMFHQLECFNINKNISIYNLKFEIINFLFYFFKKQFLFRIRPSYFPFTLPSIEIDIKCIKCNGLKCLICKLTGWIEILGGGIIQDNVLYNCKINKKYSGFAFGVGIERIIMIKYKISDIRTLYK